MYPANHLNRNIHTFQSISAKVTVLYWPLAATRTHYTEEVVKSSMRVYTLFTVRGSHERRASVQWRRWNKWQTRKNNQSLCAMGGTNANNGTESSLLAAPVPLACCYDDIILHVSLSPTNKTINMRWGRYLGFLFDIMVPVALEAL